MKNLQDKKDEMEGTMNWLYAPLVAGAIMCEIVFLIKYILSSMTIENIIMILFISICIYIQTKLFRSLLK